MWLLETSRQILKEKEKDLMKVTCKLLHAVSVTEQQRAAEYKLPEDRHTCRENKQPECD